MADRLDTPLEQRRLVIPRIRLGQDAVGNGRAQRLVGRGTWMRPRSAHAVGRMHDGKGGAVLGRTLRRAAGQQLEAGGAGTGEAGRRGGVGHGEGLEQTRGPSVAEPPGRAQADARRQPGQPAARSAASRIASSCSRSLTT